ncbi:MAG: hypothetical protein MOB07_09105 [Acidobacteria bacterium]|nr:hypothetical protein [Acidobacteriota bacterium]
MLYFITGASGSGKTACLEALRRRRPDVIWHDFDEVGVPPNADKAWRQRTTEHWLQKAIQYQTQRRDTAVSGGAIYGEILACPSAPRIDSIAVCLLDCYDVVRIDRIRARGTYGDSQEMLCWASWQRMHAVDPQWRQDVIREDGASEMRWERWETWQRGDPRWQQVWRLDTTKLTIEEVAERVSLWMLEVKRMPTP